MKNESLYNKTVDILVQAYFNDTLEHGNCFACAVGNIVAANIGIKLLNDKYGPVWEGYIGYGQQISDVEKTATYVLLDSSRTVTSDIKKQINATGYSMRELAIIERAFEGADGDWEDVDTWMFNGLMAVTDVLDKIHENNDTEQTQITKKRFNKSLQPLK